MQSKGFFFNLNIYPWEYWLRLLHENNMMSNEYESILTKIKYKTIMRLKELLLVLSLPLFVDHVIQDPQISLTSKAQGEHKGDKEN